MSRSEEEYQGEEVHPEGVVIIRDLSKTELLEDASKHLWELLPDTLTNRIPWYQVSLNDKAQMGYALGLSLDRLLEEVDEDGSLLI